MGQPVERGAGKAFATLAFLYLDEVRLGANPRPGRAPLDRSLDLARKAVTIDPQSTLGLWALFCVHFHRQETAEFRKMGQRAIAANPNNPDILADFALCLCCMGDWDHGVALAEKAISLTPGNPGWYHIVPMMSHLRQDEYGQALTSARQCVFEDSLYSPMLLAACHGLLGQVRQAQQAATELLALCPDFLQSWQEILGVWHLPDDVMTPIQRGLQEAGLALKTECPQPSCRAK